LIISALSYFLRLEVLAPQSHEAAVLLAEVFSWPEVRIEDKIAYYYTINEALLE
jgi:hypothetical protein